MGEFCNGQNFFKLILQAICLDSVMVIMSALHAEGPGFDFHYVQHKMERSWKNCTVCQWTNRRYLRNHPLKTQKAMGWSCCNNI